MKTARTSSQSRVSPSISRSDNRLSGADVVHTLRLSRIAGTLIVLAAVAAGGACHWKSPIKPIMAKNAAKTLALPGSVLTSHPDPEIVRGALSYAMLQNEALLAAAPKNDD